MLRALWFIAKLTILVSVAVWLIQRPGEIEIAWQGYVIETSVGFVLALALLGLAFYTVAYRFWRGFAGAPRAWRRYRLARNREQGYRDVTSGLVAVAAGDGRAAEKYARRAQRLIPEAPLTRLLTAQSWQVNGDAVQSRRAFAELLDDKAAAFFGVRGLLQETLAAGDYRGALEHIRTASDLQPHRVWVLRTLFDLETRNRAWKRAETALRRGEKHGVFTRPQADRHRQALLLARADDAWGNSDFVHAHKLAAAAFNISPAFTPAATRLVRFYDQVGKTKSSLTVLARAWEANPHPDLAELWMRRTPQAKKKTASPYEEGEAAWQWAQRLYNIHPAHRDSLRMMGAAAMAARHWREARDYLTRGADYRNLARLERVETGNEARAREWLEIMAEHPPEPKWACTSCGHASLDWSPLCRKCGVFDAAEWMVPDAEHLRPHHTALPPVNDVASPPMVSGF